MTDLHQQPASLAGTAGGAGHPVSPEEARLDASELSTARRQTAVAALVGFVGNIVGAILTSIFYGGGFGNVLRYGHATICAAVFTVVWLRPPTRKLLITLYAIMTVPILPLLVVWTLAVPESRISESFIAIKMVLMGVALLTPLSLWLGLALLIGLSLETVALWALHLASRCSTPCSPWRSCCSAPPSVA
jgi:hypothetical protein